MGASKLDRSSVIKSTGMAMIGIPALRSLSLAANMKDHTRSLDRKSIESLAAEYTTAWNTGSPQNVAAYFAENGEIVINRDAPSTPLDQLDAPEEEKRYLQIYTEKMKAEPAANFTFSSH
jgi:hypothetical protein